MRKPDEWLLLKLVGDALLRAGPTPVAQLASLTKMMKDIRPAPNFVVTLEWGTVNLKALIRN
jgi:hypothetical protein